MTVAVSWCNNKSLLENEDEISKKIRICFLFKLTEGSNSFPIGINPPADSWTRSSDKASKIAAHLNIKKQRNKYFYITQYIFLNFAINSTLVSSIEAMFLVESRRNLLRRRFTFFRCIKQIGTLNSLKLLMFKIKKPLERANQQTEL